MKKVLLFFALFLFVFGVFVRLGKKNFPADNKVAGFGVVPLYIGC